MEGIEATRILCRVNNSEWIVYGIRDASGDGCGVYIHIDDHLRFRYE